MPAWLNRSGGVAARNGTTTHTITFSTDGSAPFTPTNGRLLVMVAAGAVTTAFSAGWTKRVSAISGTELAIATITAASTTSVTLTHNASNYPIAWLVYEYPSGSAYVSQNSAAGTAIGAAQPTVSSLDGTAHTVIYAADMGYGGTNQGPSSATWTVTEDLDQDVPADGVTDGVWLGVASEDATTATSVTTTPTITNTGAGGVPVERGTMVITAASGSSGTTGVLAGSLASLSAPSGTFAGSLISTGVLAGSLASLAAPSGTFAGSLISTGVLAGSLASLAAPGGTFAADGRIFGVLAGSLASLAAPSGTFAGGALPTLGGTLIGSLASLTVLVGQWSEARALVHLYAGAPVDLVAPLYGKSIDLVAPLYSGSPVIG